MRSLPKFLTFNMRQRDALGIAYAQIKPISRYASATGGSLGPGAVSSERIIEAYYKAQITDGFAFIPSVQLIFDRAGDKANDVDTVIGLRTNFYF
jgi:carbohydrate-selective porin OprB